MYPSVSREASMYIATCWRHREDPSDEEIIDEQCYIYNLTPMHYNNSWCNVIIEVVC